MGNSDKNDKHSKRERGKHDISKEDATRAPSGTDGVVGHVSQVVLPSSLNPLRG